MRLAFVHKTYGGLGGTEGVMASLVRGLAERGHDLDVFVAQDRSGPVARARVHVLRLLGRRAGGLPSLGLMLTAALRIRRGKYDQVLHFGRTGPAGIYRAGGGCHRAWLDLLTLRSSNPWSRLRLRCSLGHRLRLWHERRALESPETTFVVPSEEARRQLLDSYGAVAAKVRVIHNGVDTLRFSPEVCAGLRDESRREWGILPGEVCLLFLGSDPWRKGLDRLLHVFAQLRRGNAVSLRLLVVGYPRAHGWARRMVRELGLEDAVVFGAVEKHPERAYAAADLLALPTRHDPFANVTLEALSCGLPVVTTACNGATEAVAGCAALELVPEGDESALLKALQRAVSSVGVADVRRAARTAALACGQEQAVEAWERLLGEVSGE